MGQCQFRKEAIFIGKELKKWSELIPCADLGVDHDHHSQGFDLLANLDPLPLQLWPINPKMFFKVPINFEVEGEALMKKLPYYSPQFCSRLSRQEVRCQG